MIPAYYNKNEVKILLQNQIFDEYDIKVKFDGEIKYSLFPKPHFRTKNLLITHNENDIAKSDHTKIYVSAKKFFSLKKLFIKSCFKKSSTIFIIFIKFFYKCFIFWKNLEIK